MKSRLFLFLSATGLALSPLVLHAQERVSINNRYTTVQEAPTSSTSVDDRMDRLERDLLTLQQSLYKGKPVPTLETTGVAGAASAAIEVRITQMEEQLRSFNGRIEQLEFQVRDINDRAKNEAAMKAANSAPLPSAAPPVSALPTEGKVVTIPTTEGSTTATPPTSKPTSTTNLTDGDAIAKEYDKAHVLLRQARYPEAIAAFDTFLKAHPDHALAGNAYYWLGETHYVEKNYAKAAELFFHGFQKFPKAPKAADGLLKLGMSLKQLNKNKEACATFAKLKKAFPDMPASIRQQMETESSPLACK